MAPNKPEEDVTNKVVDSSDGFEESDSTHKVIVNSRPRVTKPEDTSDELTEAIDTKPVAPDKPIASTSKKSNVLKPDIGESEAQSPESDDSQVVNDLAQEAAEKKADKESTSDDTQQKKIQNLIDNKTYFVPIGQVSKRRSTKIFVAILLLVVAACVGAFFMMVS